MNVPLNFGSVFEKYDRETILDTIQSLTKITARSISLAGYFNSTPELAEGKEIIAGIQAIFTLRSTFNSIGKIVTQVRRKEEPELTDTLKTAAATIGVATGLLSIFKFCTSQSEIVTLLSKISSSLGSTAVIGETLYSSLFLNHIASALGLLQSVIAITVDSIYIHQRSKKIDHAKQKMNLWQQPLDDAHVQLKISRLTYKYSNTANKTEAVALEFAETCQKAQSAVLKYQKKKDKFKQASGLKKAYSWIVLKSQERKKNKRIEKNLNKAEELHQCVGNQLNTFNNLNAWKKVHAKWDHLTDADQQTLDATQQNKAAKWAEKQKSLKIEQVKAALGLTLKVIGLIVTIASLILSATGVGLVPVLITMTTISLFLAVTSFGFTLFKRHMPQIKVHAVPPPAVK